MTSVKIKFRKSTIREKEGVLYIQLIHNRKTKLITTRFRLFALEWDSRLSTVILNGADERVAHLESIKTGLASEVQQIKDLISILEKRGEYTVHELVEYYINNSFNGYLYPFVQHLVKNMKLDNRVKTASIYDGKSSERCPLVPNLN